MRLTDVEGERVCGKFCGATGSAGFWSDACRGRSCASVTYLRVRKGTGVESGEVSGDGMVRRCGNKSLA